MFNRFSNASKQSLNLARQEVQRLRHDYLAPEHMLLGLIHDGRCSAAAILVEMEVALPELRATTTRAVPRGVVTGARGQLPFTLEAKKVLELAMEEAGRLSHDYIGTMHLLLGLSCEGTSIAAQELTGAGVTLDALRASAKSRVDLERDEVSTAKGIAPGAGISRADASRLLHRAEEYLEALAEHELAIQVCAVRMQLDSPARDETSELLALLASVRAALESRGESAAARAIEAAIVQIAKQR